MKVIKDKISKGEFRDKGSKFFSFLEPINNRSDYKSKLSLYKKNFPDACHVCSAYRLYLDERIDEFFSDDGEPRGSSGAPILNILKKFDLINSSIYVVRIFGGTKLGIPGLINAYSSAASGSVVNSRLIDWEPTSVVKLEYNYDLSSLIDRLVSKYKGKINNEFGEIINAKLEIKKNIVNSFKEELFSLSNGKIKILD